MKQITDLPASGGVQGDGLPTCLRVTARTSEGEIMALQHEDRPLYGLQFHPESVLTEHGYALLGNFLGTKGGRERSPISRPS